MSVFNQQRSIVIRGILIAGFLLLICRLAYLQFFNRDFSITADKQAYYSKRIYPNRGLILDRKGRPMVTNIEVYDLICTPKDLKGTDTAEICKILNIDTATFNQRCRDIRFKNGANLSGVFQSLLTTEQYLQLQEKMYAFKGFDIVQKSDRTYPYNCGGVVFGFINEVDKNDIQKWNGYFSQGDYVGKQGLERSYEDVLRGQRGVEIYIRNNKNQLVEKFEDGKYDTVPIAGRNLKTSIDIKLQQLGEKLMANKLGAAVAIDPKTGGILAMASGPGFDPNTLTGSNKRKNIANLITDPAMSNYNFAVMGKYAPGSTFKPLGALVALDEGVMTPSSGVGCGGRYYGCGGRGIGCHGGGHAGNLRSAMAASCNSYFTVAFRRALENPAYPNQRVAYQKWREYMFNFGLGHKLGVDIPSEAGGNIPDTAKLTKSIGTPNWVSCNMASMGIGQDRMLATPLQMANAMCLIANKGYYYIPHFVDSIENETAADTMLAKYRKKIKPVNIPDSSFEAVFDGMEAVITGGTARRWGVKGITICGKTGTTENYYRGKKLEEHSWFVCFAPKENPQIAIAVVVLNAGQGTQFAAPIASLMLEQYLTDTVKRQKIVEDFAAKKIYPVYVKEAKYIRDSMIAFDKFEDTGDSSYIRMYLPEPPPVVNTDSLKKVEALKKEKEEKEKKKEEEKKEKEKAEATKPKDIILPEKKPKDSLRK
jgi:penicillin-binding protein 2